MSNSPHMPEPTRKVESRREPFVSRTATRLWAELPSDTNPYIPAQALCHGYELFELMEKRRFVDVFYLLFRGELPTPAQAELLEQLMIALINPGPRHPATRAAMNAAVGKTDPVHILPIALGVMGGRQRGAGAIEDAMRFLVRARQQSPLELAAQLDSPAPDSEPGWWQPYAGFGQYFGGVELMAQGLAKRLAALEGAGDALHWGEALASALAARGMGWLMTGVAAAVLLDLGFQPRAGGSLYQLMTAPGLAAQGLELANKPITAMPFVKDEDYVVERG